MESGRYVLRLEKVSSWHPYEKTGIEEISLCVEQREFICIYGISGSGVTDLYDILTGKRKQQDGKFVICGEMHIIPERFPFFPNMTVKDYLLMPGVFCGERAEKIWKKRKELLKEHWLWKKRTMRAEFLSGFEKGILMAWNAFYGNPDVIVIGNCMQYMDDKEEKSFWKEIAGFRQETAIVCVSDRIPDCDGIDRIYKMENGTLIREEDA